MPPAPPLPSPVIAIPASNTARSTQHVQERSQPGLILPGRARDRVDLNLSQPLGTGTLSVSALEQRFWDLPGTSRQYNVTYGGYWRDLNYSLSLDRAEV